MSKPPPSPIEYQAQQRREELREERDAKRERFAPPGPDWDSFIADNCRRYDELYREMSADLSNEYRLKDILGLHSWWQGPVADAVRAFCRTMLKDVQEKLEPKREQLKAIAQERFDAKSD